MANYDLSILSDTEFEELAKDILTTHLNMDFKTFRGGRDKGIDLLYSQEGEETIVQVKHYVKSTFSNLKTAIRDEYKKMCKRNPKRYILFVSMDLSVNQCDELIGLMNGFIKSASDIFDLKRITSLLSSPKFTWIEEKYYKLWLANTTVISNILHNAQQNNIMYIVEQIRNNIPLYVITEDYFIAKRKLDKSGLLLIHGEPGVGKTVLANLLIFNYLESNFKPKFVIGHDISELEKILSRDSEEKEIIFIDDFLGSNFVELMNGNTESRLVSFILKYIQKPNKRVVLTSRTTIFNRASLEFEKLNQIQDKIVHHSIELNSYSALEKAEILYNHFYFLLNDRNYFNEILIDSRYMKIIRHKNYNPRIIQFFADKSRLNEIAVKDYYSFIMTKLDNPEDIWKYEYESKITNEERILVDTLLSFNQATKYEYLERGFENRYSYEIKVNSFIRSHNMFNKALKVLNTAFVSFEMDTDGNKLVKFLNPSIVDFLKHYFTENVSDIKRIIMGIKFIDQLYIFNPGELLKEGLINLPNNYIDFIGEFLINNFDDIEEIRHSKMKYLTMLSKATKIFDKEIEEIQYDYFNKVIDSETFQHFLDEETIYSILENSNSDSKVISLFLDNIDTIFILVISNSNYVEELAKWLELFCKLDNISCAKLLNEEYFIEKFKELIESDFENYFDEVASEFFNYTDYITIEQYNCYSFDEKSIENDISDFIDEFKYQSINLIKQAIENIYSDVQLVIEDVMEEHEYKTS
ncbi:nSTAND3 domain-containing NTPase [Fusibacter tunisiensis]|uniref:AAA+ ATPase domain-containing protein n=1 Tax=Fusibacter tunisiensis TaxID=1008308 RepID=A0ABS2MU74_9FIRM|nr:AAA family ATPase [Fusibacter tunisiensis]MBM7562957.1 hypothetical protein [Fusibacter tunisiensis]